MSTGTCKHCQGLSTKLIHFNLCANEFHEKYATKAKCLNSSGDHENLEIMLICQPCQSWMLEISLSEMNNHSMDTSLVSIHVLEY